jgi:hypothetical protein
VCDVEKSEFMVDLMNDVNIQKKKELDVPSEGCQHVNHQLETRRAEITREGLFPGN